MDAQFTNYEHRLAYASFLDEVGRRPEALVKLDQMIEEIESMERQEKRQKKNIYREAMHLHRVISADVYSG